MASKAKRKKPASAIGSSQPAKARKTNRGPTIRIPGPKDRVPAHLAGPSLAPLSGTTPPAAPVSFLDLAGELRDKIYDCVLEICPTTFAKKAKHLTSTSGLARVNKQIRGEFLSRALENAPVLKTKVINFDFTHIVTFLNNLPAADLKALDPTNQSTPAERTMLIELKFVGPSLANLRLLARWLNRAGRVAYTHNAATHQYELKLKKGANIKFQYTAGPAHPAFYLPLIPPEKYRDLGWTLSSRWGASMQRRAEEAGKIQEVLVQAHAAFETSGMRGLLNEKASEYLVAREHDYWKLWPWSLDADDESDDTQLPESSGF